MYEYKAVVNKVIDGDTVNITIDLGFHLDIAQNVRLHGINAPEKGKPGWAEAKQFLEKLLPIKQQITVVTYKTGREKYGRYLATIYVDNMDINQTMLDSGLAEEYM